MRYLALLAGTAAVVASCTEVTLVEPGGPGESCRDTSDCVEGLLCVAGQCTGTVVQPDATTDTSDIGGDNPLPPGDEGGDAPDAGDLPDGEDTPDQGDDAELPPDVPDEEPELPPDDAPEPPLDVPDGEPELPLDAPEVPDLPDVPDGDADAADEGPDVVTGEPGLGDPCDANCPVGMICMPQANGQPVCELFPQGLCAPCELDTDCSGAGAACINVGGGANTYCSSSCNNEGDCPAGFLCQGGYCQPETFSCECTPDIFGWQLPCTNINATGTCGGVITCVQTGWSNCSAFAPAAELCDGKDNDCNGITDEAPLYAELGELKPFGFPCGIGQCAGGEVVCAPDGGVTCSSNGNATFELCADTIDNDCDGTVNEGCDSPDWDGDGTINESDCNPYDAAFHSGAVEPCCPTVDFDPACDKNCDGSITPCAACDADKDGFCPPQDCNDGDPTIYAGAPEKCNDGIDQDCLGGDLLCPVGADVDNDGYIPPADCNEGNPNVAPGKAELCDNLDNNCNGVIDEGNPQGGMACGTGAEYCQQGTMVCTHYGYGAVVQCQGAIVFSEEKCDGIDNNCNGSTDETWPELGQACDGADVDMCANGVVECLGDGTGVFCTNEVIENLVEECNGIDDDCNGATDEFVCNLDDLDGDGWTEAGGDCDDFKSEYHPGAAEPCCDPALGAAGQVLCDLNCDNIVVPCAVNDLDADGFGGPDDCGPDDPNVYPGAPEKCGDGIDQDCQGGDLDCLVIQDVDKDGFPAGVDCNDTNQNVNPWAAEICNYIDDNCDGVIDDGNPAGKTGPCGPDTPECTPGEWVCVHDEQTYSVQVLCINDNFQAPELCNELDDNCDGETDETFYDKYGPCDGPDADSCENGIFGCSEDGLGVVCGEEEVVDIPEVCDNLDNDCDGETDEGLSWEGLPLGDICDGIGECGAGVVVCNLTDTATCSTNPDGPFPQVSDEACNDLDDDCDGETDEDFLYEEVGKGGACDGIGECGLGFVECSLEGGGATCSTNHDGTGSQALPEICNLLDDDCDGASDEEIPLELSACKQVGVCAEGGVVHTCSSEDTNEDGEPDIGVWLCDYAAVANYQDEETLCDGLDNDCDGVTDEDWPLGQPCDGPDSDQCENGTWQCAPSMVDVACVNEVVVDLVEECNFIDDDCDGTTDELDVDPVEQGCDTTGVCSLTWAIQVFCSEVGLYCDYSNIAGWQPEETLCDGLDNDCDGETDEGLLYNGLAIGEACDGIGECGAGVVECDFVEQVPVCSTDPGGSGDQSTAELCNLLDDDCDGAPDEDFIWEGLGIGATCDPSGQCGPGIVECDAELGAVCSTAPGGTQDQSTPEVCDSVDNDCDGQVNELEDLDYVNESGCLLEGVCSDPNLFVACVDGTWQCNYTNLPAWQQDESACDYLDNDCDGETDETFPLLGTLCDGPDADECPTGEYACDPTGGGLECVNETGIGQPELCDGLDNDCNGLTDDGLTYQGKPKGALCDGVGACGLGTVECAADGSVTCSTNPNGSQPQAIEELCNGADDDCDGTADEALTWEGLGLGETCDGTGECGVGVVECSPTGATVCSTMPGGSSPENQTESCDNLDNDCDGVTDNDVGGFGDGCDDNGDFCATGTTTCEGGVESCVGDVACAPGTICYDGTQPNSCLCPTDGLPCNTNAGDSCGPSGCTCNGGLPCNLALGEVCVSGFGCTVP